jgi:hypothetical protein
MGEFPEMPVKFTSTLLIAILIGGFGHPETI